MVDSPAHEYTTHNYDEINRHVEEAYRRDRTVRRARQAKIFSTYALYSSIILAGLGLLIFLALLGISFLGEKKEIIPPATEPIINIFMGSMATPAADNLSGTDGADKLNGAGGDDTISGKSGNDILGGGPDDDSIDGGQGFDTAIFIGKREEYKITFRDEIIILQDTKVSRDGTDRLTNVEALQFSDGTISVGQASIDETLRIVSEGSLESGNSTGGGEFTVVPKFTFSIFETIERTRSYTVQLGRKFKSHDSLSKKIADEQWCYLETRIDTRFGNISKDITLALYQHSNRLQVNLSPAMAKEIGVGLKKLKKLQNTCYLKMKYYS